MAALLRVVVSSVTRVRVVLGVGAWAV